MPQLLNLISFALAACLVLAAFGVELPKHVVEYVFASWWLRLVAFSLLAHTVISCIRAAVGACKTQANSAKEKEPPPTPLEESDHKLRERAFTKADDKEPDTAAFVPLQNLIGLASVKKEVAELKDYIAVQKMRTRHSLRAPRLNLHLVFTGNPGTGKTTVAREIARMYKAMGLLPKDHVSEVDRSQLVGGYLGQTAIKTKEAIDKAMGGILFIDEAYSLARTNDSAGTHMEDPFGKEAIEVLLKEMEDHRNSFAVIVAGYTEEMKGFIASNPGLQSRFTRYIHFPDYSAKELFQIFQLMCKENEYDLDEDAATELAERLVTIEGEIGANGNARYIRNLFESVLQKQASRVTGFKNPNRDDLKKILTSDIAAAIIRSGISEGETARSSR